MTVASLITAAYMLEIYAAELIMLWHIGRRKYFGLRLGLVLLVGLTIAVFVPDNPFERYTLPYAATNFVKFFGLFSVSVAGMTFCFRASFWSVLSMCTAGYAVQHLSQRSYVIVNAFVPLFDGSVSPWVMVVRELLFFTPFYVLFYFLTRSFRKARTYDTDVKLNAISIGIIFLCMVASRVQDFGPATNVSAVSNSLYAILCCVIVLTLQLYIRSMNAKEQEYNTIKYLYAKEKEEYRHWQNSIDVINIKCHDLKHQIKNLRHHYSEKQIREIENSVMIYDSALKTGNEVLDIILFEKNLFCERNQIEFIYMVEGEALQFVEKDELFALFSNIIDNAIEAAMGAEEEKRIIQLTVKEMANLVLIHEENYFVGKMQIEDGFPVTKKEDKDNHGFGVRSIRKFAEDYNGTMRFQVENEMFSLTICIPKPEAAADAAQEVG